MTDGTTPSGTSGLRPPPYVPPRDLASRVEELERARAQRDKPWYRQASVLIAALALAFSVTATWLGEVRAAERDEAAARVELSQLIQRLVALPRENIELQAAYADDAAVLNSLGGMIATEHTVLARQAHDVIDRVDEHATGAEYFAVAQALYQTGNYGAADALLDEGIAIETDPFSLAALWRVKGQVAFTTGEPERARDAMAHALGVFAAQPPNIAAAADAYTELLWAESEQVAGDCAAAAEHLDLARRHLGVLMEVPYTASLRTYGDQIEARFPTYCPGW